MYNDIGVLKDAKGRKRIFSEQKNKNIKYLGLNDRV